MAKRRVKIIKVWGGFLSGRLDDWSIGAAKQLAIWRSRKEAQKRYQDVRRIEIYIQVK